MTIESSTEAQFDISFTKITWKNTLLNSKNAVLRYFARLFRLWVVSAAGCFSPKLFQFVGLFGLSVGMANKNLTVSGFIFFFIQKSKGAQFSVSTFVYSDPNAYFFFQIY